MRVLLTGASGFLGRHLAKGLSSERLVKVGRSGDQGVRCDLTRDVPALPQCDLVVHAAGRAHVAPRTEEDVRALFDVNVTGTSHLLSALDRIEPPEAFVLVSTVAIYAVTSGSGFDESVPAVGSEPYGRSKRVAESLVTRWCAARGVRCAILRLPLVAGASPPGHLGAMIRAVRWGYYFNVGGGGAARSVVLADDVARIVRRAAEVGGIYNLTDGRHPTFAQLGSLIARQLGRREPATIPYPLAGLLASAGDLLGRYAPINSAKLRILTTSLTFDDSRARALLAWRPTAVIDGFRIA